MIKTICTFGLVILVSMVFAQEKKGALPSVELKTLDYSIFSTADIANDGKPILISFWATWCKPCVKELSAYAENYDDWKAQTGLKIVAVSIDNSKSTSKVAPFVNGKAWEFDVLLDANSDFKRAMNVINVPHTFLLNADRQIVWQHSSFADGDEEELIELIKKVAAGEEISQ